MSLISPDSMAYIFVADCAGAYLHCARRGELPNLTEVSRKIPEKTHYVGSRSFKVIEFGSNRTRIYHFLLVTNIIFGSVLHAFRVTATKRSKITLRTHPCLI